MKDRLEDFVRGNRQQFDDREPSSRVWRNIALALGLGRGGRDRSLAWWRAAAVFFMALSLFLLIHRQHMKAENALAMQEFSDVEAFYVQQISNKVEMIDDINGNDGLSGLTHDFQQLEAMYLVLKEEMKARPSEKVKDALVLNLLVRIDLLNQQLERLDQQVEEDVTADKKEQRST